jgi:hypothetical protein
MAQMWVIFLDTGLDAFARLLRIADIPNISKAKWLRDGANAPPLLQCVRTAWRSADRALN